MSQATRSAIAALASARLKNVRLRRAADTHRSASRTPCSALALSLRRVWPRGDDGTAVVGGQLGIRPVDVVEPGTVQGYVASDELRCENSIFRAVEATMREHIRHFDEVGDDIVLEPYYRISWDLVTSSWGVDVVQVPAEVGEGETSPSYTFNFPIKTPADAALLRPRTFGVDRESTLALQRLLEDTFGDLLPIRVGNYDHFQGAHGMESWAGNYFLGLTQQVYRFIGNDGLIVSIMTLSTCARR